MPTLFVTGTDTGCGKTHVSCALLKALRQAGEDAVGYKPVAAGCEGTPSGLRNEDALALQSHSNGAEDYAAINPVALAPPVAPHLAAARAGVTIDPGRLVAGAEALAARHDWVIVEGAGGFLVPLGADTDFADLVGRAHWPVLLVVGMRLGCLNHALLTVEAIARRGRLAGWVANALPPRQDWLEENIATLRDRIAAPCLGVVAPDSSIDTAALALDLSALRLRKIHPSG